MYIVKKAYKPHGFKVGNIVGMNEDFAKELIEKGIIEPIDSEEARKVIRKETNHG